MHFIRGAAVLSAAFMLASAGAFAQTPNIESTPIPAAAKPDFSKMMFLSGTWNCSIMSARRPTPYKTTSTATVSPDGYWLVTRTTTHPAAWIPRELQGEDRITYDPSTSRWVDIATDEEGGYDLSTSPGWNGNEIVWTDIAYPQSNATAANNPTTVTKVSDTQTRSVSSFKEPSGRVVSVTSTCTKSS